MAFSAKYHGNSESRLKKVCKKYLGNAGEKTTNIALPFFEAVKKFTVKPPSLGHYIIKLFTTFMGLTLLLRCIDGVTDSTLTVTYFRDWDTVLSEFLSQTLCTSPNQQCKYSDVAYMKELCTTSEWSQRLVCSFTRMSQWIPGTITVIIMILTLIYEVISTRKFTHYFSVFSGICCEEHNKGWITAYRFILPFTLQISALIYEHWIITFFNYWQGKSKSIAATATLKEEKKCTKCHGKYLLLYPFKVYRDVSTGVTCTTVVATKF